MSAYIEIAPEFWIDPADVKRQLFVADATEWGYEGKKGLLLILRDDEVLFVPCGVTLAEQTGNRIQQALKEDRETSDE